MAGVALLDSERRALERAIEEKDALLRELHGRLRDLRADEKSQWEQWRVVLPFAKLDSEFLERKKNFRKVGLAIASTERKVQATERARTMFGTRLNPPIIRAVEGDVKGSVNGGGGGGQG